MRGRELPPAAPRQQCVLLLRLPGERQRPARANVQQQAASSKSLLPIDSLILAACC